jgi:hypothetical protein
MSSADNLLYRPGIRAGGFNTVVKKTRNKPGNFSVIPISVMHISRPIMVGVRNSQQPPCAILEIFSYPILILMSWSQTMKISCMDT